WYSRTASARNSGVYEGLVLGTWTSLPEPHTGLSVRCPRIGSSSEQRSAGPSPPRPGPASHPALTVAPLFLEADLQVSISREAAQRSDAGKPPGRAPRGLWGTKT